MRSRDFKTKKVVERPKVFHFKMLTKVVLEIGYGMWIITSDNRVINIKEKKKNTLGCVTSKECSIMRTGSKAKLSDGRAKRGKPSSWSLFETI